jgi:hypothetical protein
MTAGRRVLYVFAALWVLTPVLATVRACQSRGLPTWMTALAVVLTLVLSALLALVVLAVVEPVDREQPGPRPRADGTDGDRDG